MADEYEYWWSIEVLDAELPASRWRDAYAAALIEAAISHGAKDWNWNRFDWGVVFEIAFVDYAAWSVFRELPAVVAALDAVPDPINGLLIYPGRGGSSATRVPRNRDRGRDPGPGPRPSRARRSRTARRGRPARPSSSRWSAGWVAIFPAYPPGTLRPRPAARAARPDLVENGRRVG